MPDVLLSARQLPSVVIVRLAKLAFNIPNGIASTESLRTGTGSERRNSAKQRQRVDRSYHSDKIQMISSSEGGVVFRTARESRQLVAEVGVP